MLLHPSNLSFNVPAPKKLSLTPRLGQVSYDHSQGQPCLFSFLTLTTWSPLVHRQFPNPDCELPKSGGRMAFALVCSGCYNIPWTGGLTNDRLISHSPGVWEVPRPRCLQIRSLVRARFWFTDGCLLILSLAKGARELSGGSLLMGMNPIRKGSTPMT